MTLDQITDYITTHWPEIVDASHAAHFVEGLEDTEAIDKKLGFYVRYI